MEASDYGLPALTHTDLIDLFAMIKGDPGKFGAAGLSFTGNPSDGAKALRDAVRYVQSNRLHIPATKEETA